MSILIYVVLVVIAMLGIGFLLRGDEELPSRGLLAFFLLGIGGSVVLLVAILWEMAGLISGGLGL